MIHGKSHFLWMACAVVLGTWFSPTHAQPPEGKKFFMGKEKVGLFEVQESKLLEEKVFALGWFERTYEVTLLPKDGVPVPLPNQSMKITVRWPVEAGFPGQGAKAATLATTKGAPWVIAFDGAKLEAGTDFMTLGIGQGAKETPDRYITPAPDAWKAVSVFYKTVSNKKNVADNKTLAAAVSKAFEEQLPAALPKASEEDKGKVAVDFLALIFHYDGRLLDDKNMKLALSRFLANSKVPWLKREAAVSYCGRAWSTRAPDTDKELASGIVRLVLDGKNQGIHPQYLGRNLRVLYRSFLTPKGIQLGVVVTLDPKARKVLRDIVQDKATDDTLEPVLKKALLEWLDEQEK
jgi:hypothetical protein